MNEKSTQHDGPNVTVHDELELTDDGLEMPDMLRGYVGSFKLRTASITGDFETTESGLPDEDYYDGPIAAYPSDGGDYNQHLSAGFMSFETADVGERVFKILDNRTEEA